MKCGSLRMEFKGTASKMPSAIEDKPEVSAFTCSRVSKR